ncbi:RecQ family ATP-dependent DNA helicase [Wenyingzhuangia sp. IMCC45533]
MHNTVNLKETLRKYWGHASFRPLQLNIINDVINNKDTLAVLPTGGGKSICYQLPALIKPGTCLVISPLLALINDQIENLKQKNIKAVTIPSGSRTEDVVRIFDNISIKKIKLLYLSPERLSQPLIQEKIKQLDISFIAVDEAHCISQWGHDFRPAYLKIQLLRTLLPNKNIVALTATATCKTQEQIVNLLHFKKDYQKHIDSFNRPNLAYQVFVTPNKIDLLYKMLQKLKAPTIIYLQNRLAVQELSNRLCIKGYRSTYYHAGLNKNTKQKHLNLWYTEEKNIMVATNAFGMGIDKNNVRLVIHLEIPNHLENYLQEAGRAGRDQKKSFSCVILSKSDYIKYEAKNKSIIDTNMVIDVYQKLNQHFQIALGEKPEEEFDFDIDVFCNKYKLSINSTEKILRRLDNYDVILFKEQPKDACSLKLIATQHQIIQFTHQQTEYSTLISYILRNYAGIFDIEKRLNIDKISSAIQMSTAEISKKLAYLNQIALANFKPNTHHHSIQFLVPREDKKTINPIKKELNLLCDIDEEKHRKNLNYFLNEKICRNTFILNYFDQKEKDNCGICDICVTNKKIKDIDTLYQYTLKVINSKPHTFNELLTALKINSSSLKRILQHLLSEEKIIHQQQFFKINE